MEIKPLAEILKRVKETHFSNDFDLVVAIARGGLFPGAILVKHLNIPMEILWINLRDDNHKELHENPNLMKKVNFEFKNKKILLVDDVSRSGKTLTFAKNLLTGATLVKTLVVNGKSDYSLFDETCFKFPWNEF